MSVPKADRSSGAGKIRSVWLGPELLVLSGLEPIGPWAVASRTGRKNASPESASLVYSKDGADPVGMVLVRLPGSGRSSPPDSIVLTTDGREQKIGRATLAKSEIAFAQLLNEDLAGGDAASRDELQELIRRIALPVLDEPGGLALAARLRELRDIMLDPLPTLVSGPESPQAASIDLIMAVNDRSFWVVGWVRDADRTLRDLVLVTPEGGRVDVLRRSHRLPRADVQAAYGDGPEERHGFVAYLRLDQPSLLDSGWIALLERTDDSATRLQAPEVVRDLAAVRVRILDDFGKEAPDRESLRLQHALPAITTLQERHARSIAIDDIAQFGDPPPSPEVSIVIPLYERIDLVEHQLAHFGHDPQLAASDIVFVLDSPELAATLYRLAADLQALYGIPFRVVKLSRNAGYAGANNIGASQASGRLLLLLNSDVIPVQPGWLGQMAAFYDSTPEIGALGPKLLFEDLSIQHAGMYFRREADTSLWGNLHYYKGFHRDFAAAGASRPVPAVTGACMLVARDLYQELGGLRYGYVQGSYEDSDFCIRLAERGLHNWYLAAVELYHLEAQSFPSPERALATAYNKWLQTHLWNARIEEIMRDQEASRAPDRLEPGSPLSRVA